jgi:hypothetical protein
MTRTLLLLFVVVASAGRAELVTEKASLPSIRLVDGRFHFTFSRTDCTTCAQAKPVALNEWHHVALTWSALRGPNSKHVVQLFVDGASVAKATTQGSQAGDFLNSSSAASL